MAATKPTRKTIRKRESRIRLDLAGVAPAPRRQSRGRIERFLLDVLRRTAMPYEAHMWAARRLDLNLAERGFSCHDEIAELFGVPKLLLELWDGCITMRDVEELTSWLESAVLAETEKRGAA